MPIVPGPEEAGRPLPRRRDARQRETGDPTAEDVRGTPAQDGSPANDRQAPAPSGAVLVPLAGHTPPAPGPEVPPGQVAARRRGRQARGGAERYVWAGAALAAVVLVLIGLRITAGDRALVRYHHYADLSARQCLSLPRPYLQGCLYGAALQLADPRAAAETLAERRRLYAAYAAGGPFARAECVLLPTDAVEGCIERTSAK